MSEGGNTFSPAQSRIDNPVHFGSDIDRLEATVDAGLGQNVFSYTELGLKVVSLLPQPCTGF